MTSCKLCRWFLWAFTKSALDFYKKKKELRGKRTKFIQNAPWSQFCSAKITWIVLPVTMADRCLADCKTLFMWVGSCDNNFIVNFNPQRLVVSLSLLNKFWLVFLCASLVSLVSKKNYWHLEEVVSSTSFTGIQFKQTFKGQKMSILVYCILVCISIPGFPRFGKKGFYHSVCNSKP